MTPWESILERPMKLKMRTSLSWSQNSKNLLVFFFKYFLLHLKIFFRSIKFLKVYFLESQTTIILFELQLRKELEELQREFPKIARIVSLKKFLQQISLQTHQLVNGTVDVWRLQNSHNVVVSYLNDFRMSWILCVKRWNLMTS